jgi:hypothetical protein
VEKLGASIFMVAEEQLLENIEKELVSHCKFVPGTLPNSVMNRVMKHTPE